MKSVIVFTWNSGDNKGDVFGVFTTYDKAHIAIKTTAKAIKTTVENLRLDLYITEVVLNKSFAN